MHLINSPVCKSCNSYCDFQSVWKRLIIKLINLILHLIIRLFATLNSMYGNFNAFGGQLKYIKAEVNATSFT